MANNNWNNASGAIDRVFRSIEMLAITALVGVVATTYSQTALVVTTLFGTLGAVYYLAEPTINWFADMAVGAGKSIHRLILAFVILFLGTLSAFWLTPALTVIPLTIAKTITLATK